MIHVFDLPHTHTLLVARLFSPNATGKYESEGCLVLLTFRPRSKAAVCVADAANVVSAALASLLSPVSRSPSPKLCVGAKSAKPTAPRLFRSTTSPSTSGAGITALQVPVPRAAFGGFRGACFFLPFLPHLLCFRYWVCRHVNFRNTPLDAVVFATNRVKYEPPTCCRSAFEVSLTARRCSLALSLSGGYIYPRRVRRTLRCDPRSHASGVAMARDLLLTQDDTSNEGPPLRFG
uniref:Uncharacterized protein n=1 Tax=Neobodo designis TaxID=312471 RepID=A0A7S1LY48_NEODS|mmetsp:Transcript_30502/g.94216  ORF Transcript_30502/g.94216 Transcript_30502/m.94216 type:complete len:234 (+) Transcript_30502:365-1066(+)